MIKKTENATVNFQPESISENCTVTFARTTNANGTVINGRIRKDDAEVGSISYSSRDNYLIVSLKPLQKLTDEEQSAIMASIKQWVADVIAA